jgi:hypothetical protein
LKIEEDKLVKSKGSKVNNYEEKPQSKSSKSKGNLSKQEKYEQYKAIELQPISTIRLPKIKHQT